MSDQPRAQVAPVEPYFDRTPEPFGVGLPDPLVYDASARALRQRTVNFAAKRRADMRYISGLDRGTVERHFRWRPAVAPGGLGFRASPDGQAELVAAHRAGDISIDMDDTDRRVTIRWTDASIGESVVGSAVAPPGYGAIVMGPHLAEFWMIEREIAFTDLAGWSPAWSRQRVRRCRPVVSPPPRRRRGQASRQATRRYARRVTAPT